MFLTIGQQHQQQNRMKLRPRRQYEHECMETNNNNYFCNENDWYRIRIATTTTTKVPQLVAVRSFTTSASPAPTQTWNESSLLTSSSSSSLSHTIDHNEDDCDDDDVDHNVTKGDGPTQLQQQKKQHTYVVAMSGGVDSSVAAATLVHQNINNKEYNVVGIHMSNWNRYDDDTMQQQLQSSCLTSTQDYIDVQQVTSQILHIPLLSKLNDETTYWCHVFEPYIHNLLVYGYMGNPDIDCNTYVKFHSLLQHCLSQQLPPSPHNHEDGNNNNNNNSITGTSTTPTTTTLVTGHYARLWYRDDNKNNNADSSLPHRRGGTRSNGIPEWVEEEFLEQSEYRNELDWLRTWGVTTKSDTVLTPLLLSARDTMKDQSYFLSGVNPYAFHHVYFPVGDYYKHSRPTTERKQCNNNYNDNDTESESQCASTLKKPTVREMAKLYQLTPVQEKRDSMGLCFVGNQKHNRTTTMTNMGKMTTSGYTNFISNYLPLPKKYLQFRHVETNEVMYETLQPQHAVLYTPGQGMKIPGGATKYFCVDHNYSHVNYQELVNHHTEITSAAAKSYHPITICPGTHHPSLYSDCIHVDYIHWLSTVPPPPLQRSKPNNSATMSMDGIQCRTRHLQPLTDCSIHIPSSYPIHDDQSHHPYSKNNWKMTPSHYQRYRHRHFDSANEEERYNTRYRILIHCHCPIRAITPGQRVVFYTMNGLVCLGSAIIISKSRSYYELGKSLPF